MSVTTALKPLTPAAADTLRAATATDSTIALPPGQLDRKVYAEVDKALTRIGGGGRWDRRRKVHVFPADPRPELAQLIGDGMMPVDQLKAMGYFRTPDGIARLVTGYLTSSLDTEQPIRVLEPSAGDGSLVRAVLDGLAEHGVEAFVEAVEPDLGRHADLWARTKQQPVETHSSTFEDFIAHRWDGRPYDAVVMNPPFALPGKPRAGVEHVLAAWDLLAPGGYLVAILPDTLASTSNRLIRRLGDLIDEHGEIRKLPAAAFRESGTYARTCCITMRKPT